MEEFDSIIKSTMFLAAMFSLWALNLILLFYWMENSAFAIKVITVLFFVAEGSLVWLWDQGKKNSH